MHDLRRFFRQNPQVLVLLVICVVLGLGTFLIVVFGLATAGKNAQPNGEPSGAITRPQRLVVAADAGEGVRPERWAGGAANRAGSTLPAGGLVVRPHVPIG